MCLFQLQPSYNPQPFNNSTLSTSGTMRSQSLDNSSQSKPHVHNSTSGPGAMSVCSLAGDKGGRYPETLRLGPTS